MEFRAAHLAEQRELTGSAADDYFLYDAVLETAMMLGIATPWAAEQLTSDPFAALTALARGTPEHEAWEMTKWFDTNYHYVVPEITAPVTAFRPLPWREPMGDGATWVVIGPYTLARLSHLADGLRPGDRGGPGGHALWAWVGAAGANPAFACSWTSRAWAWPCPNDEAMRHAAYAGAPQVTQVPIVTVQFGEPSDETARGPRPARPGGAAAARTRLSSTPASTQPELVVSVMDGRSVWPDDLAPVRQALTSGEDRTVRLVPSTSLMFLPYTVEGEDLPAGFQFAREKARRSHRGPCAGWRTRSRTAAAPTTAPGRRSACCSPASRDPNGARRSRTSTCRATRPPPPARSRRPATCATCACSCTRASWTRPALRRRAIGHLITDAIGWQEQIGLDVLVHGEFERTDMVEYFAEQMDGYVTTAHGWVTRYGSRRGAAHPDRAADHHRTDDRPRVAPRAGHHAKPVKGMLTGPVTNRELELPPARRAR